MKDKGFLIHLKVGFKEASYLTMAYLAVLRTWLWRFARKHRFLTGVFLIVICIVGCSGTALGPPDFTPFGRYLKSIVIITSKVPDYSSMFYATHELIEELRIIGWTCSKNYNKVVIWVYGGNPESIAHVRGIESYCYEMARIYTECLGNRVKRPFIVSFEFYPGISYYTNESKATLLDKDKTTLKVPDGISPFGVPVFVKLYTF